MQIKLVAIHTSLSPQSLPLANAFLKSFAAETTVEISLNDFYLSQDPDEIAARLAAANPEAIGFSVYVWNRIACLKVAGCLRKRLPSVLLFAGGPEVTADIDGLMDEGVFDLLITGEGEIPFLTLCRQLLSGAELSGINGIILPGDTKGSPGLPVTDLDQIPSPYLSGVLDAANFSGILWQLSRGCSFACDFCFDSRGNLPVRRFSMARIEAELHHFAAKNVSQVFVLDSTFNQDARRAKQILRLIGKIAPQIHFHFEVRSEFIDQEMAELFSRITCSLQIGLQSADRQVLRQVGRSFAPQDFSRRIAYLNNCGAVFGFDLIYGLPGDSLSGFCNSLDYALALYPNHIDIFPLAVLPGTRLAENASNLGLNWHVTPPYTLISTSSFGSADLASAAQMARAVDIFYTRGKAVAWFNSVISSLKLKPSAFMGLFAEWLHARQCDSRDESDFSDLEIWEMQRLFLSGLFDRGNLKRFLPIVLDLVDYHYYYAAALLTPQPAISKPQRSTAKLSQTVFSLPASTRLAEFNYDILELLDCGEPNLPYIHQHLKAAGSHAVIYPNQGQICTESFDASFYSILERINGRTTMAEILGQTGLAINDVSEFLIFAQQEGIIIKA